MNPGTARPEPVLDGLREQARRLVAEVDGPLRRVHVRSGDAVVEIEWHGAGARDPAPAADRFREPAPATSGSWEAPPTDPAPPSGVAVLSPVVGTFYRAAEPGAAPFVAVGDVVVPGQVVGIVEAMKLMNEVTAERAGRVAALLVGDGEPVEFDQPLITLVPG